MCEFWRVLAGWWFVQRYNIIFCFWEVVGVVCILLLGCFFNLVYLLKNFEGRYLQQYFLKTQIKFAVNHNCKALGIFCLS